MDLKQIEIKKIHSPKILLRLVKESSLEFKEMLDSIRDNGLWQPILVRERDDGDYELVDGNYRLTCCRKLHFEKIPALIRQLSDDEILLAQFQANGIRPETSVVEFAQRLEDILTNNPQMTVSMLARYVRKGPSWLGKILSLNTAGPQLKKMITRGEISVSSAIVLLKLPMPVRELYIEDAKKMHSSQFKALVSEKLKQIREKSRNAYINEHSKNQDRPIPYIRKFSEIRLEFKTPVVAGQVLLQEGAKTAMDGWIACLKWIFSVDKESLKKQELMIISRNTQEREAEKKRKEERKKLRALKTKNLNLESMYE
jgi:ParB/RepB/Spo0J family partition protein